MVASSALDPSCRSIQGLFNISLSHMQPQGTLGYTCLVPQMKSGRSSGMGGGEECGAIHSEKLLDGESDLFFLQI